MNFVNAFVSLDGNDISAFVESVDLNFARETDADARMSDNTAKVLATRANWSCSLNAIQDYTDDGLDEILWGIIDANAAVTLIVRPDAGSVGAGNPNYTGSVFLTNYKPIAGQHGKQARTPIALMPAGDLARAVA